MNEPQASHSSAAGRIRCREANGEFVLHLPACPLRLLKRSGLLIVLLTFLVVFFLAWFYLLDGFLPVVLALGTLETIIFVGVVALVAAPYLKTTSVLLTRDRAVVKTAVYGKEEIREYALDDNSRARQWYSPRARRRSSTPDHSGPQGIEIGSDPYNPEADDIDLTDETKPRFGEELPRGELDWVQWQINRFLDGDVSESIAEEKLQTDRMPIEGLPEETVARPRQTLVRIVEDPFESRIIFPNTVENRSFSGIRSVLLGLAMLAYPLYVLVRWIRETEGANPREVPWLSVLAVVSVLAVAEALKGVTRLLGRRRLIITPETITYRTTLFGIGLPLRLPTADVISVGTPRRSKGRTKTKNVASAKGSVIRTAERELNYSEALRGLPENEKRWIVSEIARRIDTAHSGNLSLRQ